MPWRPMTAAGPASCSIFAVPPEEAGSTCTAHRGSPADLPALSDQGCSGAFQSAAAVPASPNSFHVSPPEFARTLVLRALPCASRQGPAGSEEINLASVSKGYADGTRAKPQSSRLGISGCTGRLRTRRGRNARGLAGQEFRAALGSAIHSPSRRARMCPREGPPWRRRFSCCALSAG